MSLEDQYDAWVRGLMGGGRYAATPKQAEDANDAVQQMQAQLDDLDAQIAESAAVPVVDTAALLRNAIAAVLETLRSPTATVAQKYESALSILDRCTFDKSQMLLSVSYKLTF